MRNGSLWHFRNKDIKRVRGFRDVPRILANRSTRGKSYDISTYFDS